MFRSKSAQVSLVGCLLVLIAPTLAMAEPAGDLIDFLPAPPTGFILDSTTSAFHQSPRVSEVAITFTNEQGQTLRVYLADMVAEPGLLGEYLKGAGLAQASVVPSVDLNLNTVQLSDVPDGGSPPSRTLGSWVVTNDTVDLDQADRPETGRVPGLMIYQYSFIDLYASLGRGALHTASSADIDVALMVPEVDINPLAESRLTGNAVTLSSPQLEWVDGANFAHHVEPERLELIPIETADSFVTPYANIHFDVAGWRLFDGATGAGALILAIGERFALMVESDGLRNLSLLDQVVELVDVQALEARAQAGI